MMQPRTDITLLLREWQHGDDKAHEELLVAVYDELRRMARRHLFQERADHSFRSVDLVHEAYLRLIDQTRVRWRNRNHFFAIAATMMRRILADHARRKLAAKRGARSGKAVLTPAIPAPDDADLAYLVDLDDALTLLAAEYPRQAKVVELRAFVELTIREIAGVLDVAPVTVKRDWTAAKGYLAARMSDTSAARSSSREL